MKLIVLPELDKVVQAAKEARITIREVNFVRHNDADILEALSIAIDGKEDAIGYFSYLLEQQKLKQMV